MLLPFAETVPTSEWAGPLSTVLNIGFSVLVGWYLLTKAIPKMQEDNAKEAARSREDHAKETSQARDAFLAAFKEKREEFLAQLIAMSADSKDQDKARRLEYREAIKAISDHCEKESTRRDQMMQTELVAVARASEEQSRVMEDLGAILNELKDTLLVKRNQ